VGQDGDGLECVSVRAVGILSWVEDVVGFKGRYESFIQGDGKEAVEGGGDRDGSIVGGGERVSSFVYGCEFRGFP
jgi:hypothetical protein